MLMDAGFMDERVGAHHRFGGDTFTPVILDASAGGIKLCSYRLRFRLL
jgi:hypothetical protein